MRPCYQTADPDEPERVGRLVRLVTILAVLFAFCAVANADEPKIPNFWDLKERLPKPELDGNVERLRFLTTVDFPPFNYLDDGRLSGFHVDLARRICAELNILDKCQIQALPWNELDGALTAGDGEAIIAGIAITAENREKYVFSRPYLKFPARFIMPKAFRPRRNPGEEPRG
jgi:polar amino acid transport system substrate-binding protein